MLLGGRNLLSTVALSHLKRLNLLTGRSEITVKGLRSRAFLHLLFHRARHFLLGFAMARPEGSSLLACRREICYGSRTFLLLRGRGLPPGFLEFPNFFAGRGHVTVSGHVTVKRVGRACQSRARFSRPLQRGCCVP